MDFKKVLLPTPPSPVIKICSGFSGGRSEESYSDVLAVGLVDIVSLGPMFKK